MALYLGSEKIGNTALLTKVITKEVGGAKVATGTVTSDENGVVTFPELDFTPNMITVWNVGVTQEKDDDGSYELWDGIMLMAVNQNGYWISQGVGQNSGEIWITNSTAENNQGENKPQDQRAYSGVYSADGKVYSYTLLRHQLQSALDYYDGELKDLTNATFNYAIYG